MKNFQHHQIEFNHCFIVIFDITNFSSFENACKICEEIEETRKGGDFIIYLVGNKLDLCKDIRDETCVQTDQARNLTKQFNISSYDEVSTKDLNQVFDVFSKIIIQHESSFRNLKTKRNRVVLNK